MPKSLFNFDSQNHATYLYVLTANQPGLCTGNWIPLVVTGESGTASKVDWRTRIHHHLSLI